MDEETKPKTKDEEDTAEDTEEGVQSEEDIELDKDDQGS